MVGVARRVCGVFKVCCEMALGGVWFAGSVFGIAITIGGARLSGSSGVGCRVGRRELVNAGEYTVEN